MQLGGCAGVREFPGALLHLTQLRHLRLHVANIDFLSLPQEVRLAAARLLPHPRDACHIQMRQIDNRRSKWANI